MEVTAKRCVFLGVVLIGLGTLARLQPPRVAPWRTEAWMESALPMAIPGYSMEISQEKPKQSYDAGKRQYEMLEPYGIVCRVFRRGEQGIDSVVIAGNDRDTFHDPYFCLPGQDWKIVSSREDVIPTLKRGKVPVSVIYMEHPKYGKRIAVFCYKGPSGFHPTQNTLYMDWFMTELQLSKPPEGAFYRFMSTDGETTEKDLIEFGAKYLDEALEESQGVL